MATLSGFEDFIHDHAQVRIDGPESIGFVTATCLNPDATVLHIRYQLGSRDYETAIGAQLLEGVPLASQMRIMTLDNEATVWTFTGRHGCQPA